MHPYNTGNYTMSKVLHNPKSHAPAVYIPCWLIQVPISLLSHAAKITYGRLSQWANESGIVYRSVPQLSQELGSSIGSIEKYLKELKDVGLIGTYHPQAGGVNHFEFYDHEWMHNPINEQLAYKQDSNNPPPDLTVPSVRSYGTPPPDLTDINIKEIKEIKEVIKERKKKHSRANTMVPLKFIPNENHALLAAKLHLDLNQEKNAFIDYYEAHGKKMASWDAAFRNWLRKSSEFKNKSQGKEHPVTASIREIKENMYKSEEFKQLMN